MADRSVHIIQQTEKIRGEVELAMGRLVTLRTGLPPPPPTPGGPGVARIPLPAEDPLQHRPPLPGSGPPLAAPGRQYPTPTGWHLQTQGRPSAGQHSSSSSCSSNSRHSTRSLIPPLSSHRQEAHVSRTRRPTSAGSATLQRGTTLREPLSSSSSSSNNTIIRPRSPFSSSSSSSKDLGTPKVSPSP
jgi:hypothetical protein